MPLLQERHSACFNSLNQKNFILGTLPTEQKDLAQEKVMPKQSWMELK